MPNANFISSVLGVLLAVAGCGSTGEDAVTYPIRARGLPAVPFMVGAWQVTLDAALIGFGPIYFCAARTSSIMNCPTAVAEFASGATVDGLQAQPQTLGQVAAIGAEVRSTLYGYGITWTTTQTAPTPITGSPGGHSAHFEATAVQGAATLRLIADVDVLPSLRGTLPVQGAGVDPPVLQKQGLLLDVTFDPAAWWIELGTGPAPTPFDDLTAMGGDPVIVAPGSRGYNRLVTGMTNGNLPQFEWTANR